MNLFAGSIMVSSDTIIPELEYDYVVNNATAGNKVIFIFGETKFDNSKDLIESLEEKLGDFKNYDFSIETEDNMEIIGEGYEEGIYELATFEGEHVNFLELVERFQDVSEVVSIREAEESERYGNRIIKVDFVY